MARGWLHAFVDRLVGAQPVASDAPRPEGVERRKWPRIKLDLAVTLRFASPQAVLGSETLDIGPGGAFIRMSNPRPEGTNVRLSVVIGHRELAIGGVVVRCVHPHQGDPPGVAVMFTVIENADRQYLEQFVVARTDA